MSIFQVDSIVHNYKITEELSKNALGATYAAVLVGSPVLQRVILKATNLSMVTQLGYNPQAVIAEAKALKQLSTNPICKEFISCYKEYFMYTTSDIPAIQYLCVVTDYIPGPSLQKILLAANKAPETNQLLQAMYQIAQAVDYIHTHQIAHQNIKPSNIIHDDNQERYRLVDFEFSCSQALNAQCLGKAGTVYYMSPELLQLQHDPSQQSFAMRTAHDIWSMGVVFFQMANFDHEYMNFNSNDPHIIANTIQVGQVNPSTYPYPPINNLIAAILNKDPTQRPTAGQVLVMIDQARPLCIIDGIQYDRKIAEAMVTVFGLDVDPDVDDLTLCKVLTDHLNTCNIRGNDYKKADLVKLAKLLDLDVPKKIDSATLCKMINYNLQTQQQEFARRITKKLLHALDYLSFLQVHSQGNPQLQALFEEIYLRYTELYNEAKALDAIDLDLLERSRQDATTQSWSAKQNVGASVAAVQSALAQNIVAVIVDLNPAAQIDGVPLAEFQQRILTR